MFWECHVVTSSIDKLLEQPFEQLKLQDFLDENDLIQECLNQNQRLIDYLVDKTIMPQLIEQIINLPKDENFRNANVVSELLSGDFPRIQESLLMKENFDLFYSFLTSSNQPILNPILASYFSRIINMLIIRKTTDIIDYLKERETFKDDFLNNFESTTISEILYHLISDSGEQRSNVIKWFEEINLIDGLIEKLIQTDSISMQNNITNLFNELFRLAFEQQMGLDCDFAGPTLSATIERLLNSRHDSSDGSLFSNTYEDKTSTNAADSTDKQTPLVLVQHILSKTNLEKLFDTIINRPLFVSNGCDFLSNIFDLLNRHLPTPICQSLIPKDESATDNERMEINDEGDALSSTKSSENIQNTLTNISKEPLMKIYLLILEIMPTRLPGLIQLLSTNCPPLVPSTNENSQTVKYQFISEPLGSTRLNLIKVFSKIIQTISNDFTGDKIFEVFNTNRLFSVLLELFLRHIYNNFLHAQFYSIVRSILYINSLAVKQPTDIWTRTSISDLHAEPFSNSSPFHYLQRASYKFFQSILNSSEINLFERLIDQYELNVASAKSITTSSSSDDAMSSGLLHTRFTSPNSGHIAQILRCLRDHASIFNNYSTFFKSNDEEQIDDETNVVEIRWQSALDYLNEDEKKWAAMHYTERATSNFRINSSASYLIHATSETSEATNQRRQNFHMRSFADSRTPYVDEDDDDDEIERFDIDDEMMKNEQNTNEHKVADMKKISFDPEVPTNFTEQTLWYQQDETTRDNDKLTTPPTLPDLFENHRNQQDKLNSSTESNFEQLCSIRANDGSSGLIPFQSSSTIRDEAIGDDAVFWQNHPIYLANSTEKSCIQSMSSSSDDDDIDVDDDESKSDGNIPDDEQYFVYSDSETTSNNVQSNNMMDIFRRQSSNPNSENNQLQPILSSTPERDTTNISNSSQGNQSRRTLDFTGQEQQTNGEINIKHDDDDEELTLQDNFSFLIAKGMLKRSYSFDTDIKEKKFNWICGFYALSGLCLAFISGVIVLSLIPLYLSGPQAVQRLVLSDELAIKTFVISYRIVNTDKNINGISFDRFDDLATQFENVIGGIPKGSIKVTMLTKEIATNRKRKRRSHRIPRTITCDYSISNETNSNAYVFRIQLHYLPSNPCQLSRCAENFFNTAQEKLQKLLNVSFTTDSGQIIQFSLCFIRDSYISEQNSNSLSTQTQLTSTTKTTSIDSTILSIFSTNSVTNKHISPLTLDSSSDFTDLQTITNPTTILTSFDSSLLTGTDSISSMPISSSEGFIHLTETPTIPTDSDNTDLPNETSTSITDQELTISTDLSQFTHSTTQTPDSDQTSLASNKIDPIQTTSANETPDTIEITLVTHQFHSTETMLTTEAEDLIITTLNTLVSGTAIATLVTEASISDLLTLITLKPNSDDTTFATDGTYSAETTFTTKYTDPNVATSIADGKDLLTTATLTVEQSTEESVSDEVTLSTEGSHSDQTTITVEQPDTNEATLSTKTPDSNEATLSTEEPNSAAVTLTTTALYSNDVAFSTMESDFPEITLTSESSDSNEATLSTEESNSDTSTPITQETNSDGMTFSTQRLDSHELTLSTDRTDFDEMTISTDRPDSNEVTLSTEAPHLDQTTLTTEEPDSDKTTLLVEELESTETTLSTEARDLDETTLTSEEPESSEATLSTEAPRLDQTTLISEEPNSNEATISTKEPDSAEITLSSEEPDSDETTLFTEEPSSNEAALSTEETDSDETTLLTEEPESNEATLSTDAFDPDTTTVVTEAELITTVETTTTTTTEEPPVPLEAIPGTAKALWKTIAGGDSTDALPGNSGSGTYPADQSPEKLFDKSTDTKYASTGDASGTSSLITGKDTGFYVTVRPCASILKGFVISTCINNAFRDPKTITIEGTNSIDNLNLGSNWKLLYTGSSGISESAGRATNGTYQAVDNDVGYRNYRVLVTSKYGYTTVVCYSEFQFYGIAVAASPPSIAGAATIFNIYTTSVRAIWNTLVGGSSTAATQKASGVGSYPVGASAQNLFDDDISTVYSSRGSSTKGTDAIAGKHTGFYVSVSHCEAILTEFRFYPDATDSSRDPIEITIEGSNADDLTKGSSWRLLYAGSSGLSTADRTQGTLQTFSNTQSYLSYRILVTNVRGPTTDYASYSGIKLYGYYT